MAEKRSFICNACVNFDTKSGCEKCNGQGQNFEPKNKERYDKDPKEYLKNLILGCQ